MDGGVAVTPAEAARGTCHEDEDPRVVALVERAIREDRERGGALSSRDLDTLVAAIDYAAKWPAGSGLAETDVRELIFRLRQMATRAT